MLYCQTLACSAGVRACMHVVTAGTAVSCADLSCRRLVVEQLLGMPQFVALVSSQVCSAQQQPAWPNMLPTSLSQPVSPAAHVSVMKHLLRTSSGSMGSSKIFRSFREF